MPSWYHCFRVNVGVTAVYAKGLCARAALEGARLDAWDAEEKVHGELLRKRFG